MAPDLLLILVCPVRLKVAVSGVRLQWTLQCPELGCESLLGSGWVAGEQFLAVTALQLESAPARGSGRRFSPFLSATMDSASPIASPRKPGARKLQILQTLATMLEDPKGEKVTTAALAARLGVSEAALYRHFASKAQMFEGLIEFIETTVFGLINEISARETSACDKCAWRSCSSCPDRRHDPRVLIGDALVNENERCRNE